MRKLQEWYDSKRIYIETKEFSLFSFGVSEGEEGKVAVERSIGWRKDDFDFADA